MQELRGFAGPTVRAALFFSESLQMQPVLLETRDHLEVEFLVGPALTNARLSVEL